MCQGQEVENSLAHSEDCTYSALVPGVCQEARDDRGKGTSLQVPKAERSRQIYFPKDFFMSWVGAREKRTSLSLFQDDATWGIWKDLSTYTCCQETVLSWVCVCIYINRLTRGPGLESHSGQGQPLATLPELPLRPPPLLARLGPCSTTFHQALPSVLASLP